MKKILVLICLVALIAGGIFVFRGEEEMITKEVSEFVEPSAPSVGDRIKSMFKPPAKEEDVPQASTPTYSGSDPVEVTREFLNAHREEWKLQTYHELRPVEHRTPLGSQVKYAVYQDGIPIVGLAIDFRLAANLQILEVDNRYQSLERLDLDSLQILNEEEISETALGKQYRPDPGVSNQFSKVLVVVPGQNTPELAYVAAVREQTLDSKSRPVKLLLRATDGQILKKSFSRAEF